MTPRKIAGWAILAGVVLAFVGAFNYAAVEEGGWGAALALDATIAGTLGLVALGIWLLGDS